MTHRFTPERLFSVTASLSLLAAPLAIFAACSGSSVQPLPAADSGNPGSVGEDSGSSSTDGASATDSSSSADAGPATQACLDWAQARCKRFDSCSSDLYVSIHWGDEATCEANGAALCATDLAAPGTAASATTYEACATALPAESCSDFLGLNPVAACAPLAGSVAAGAACLTSSQCQSTYCAVSSTASCGACAAVPKAGDPCTVAADCGSRGGLTCAEGRVRRVRRRVGELQQERAVRHRIELRGREEDGARNVPARGEHRRRDVRREADDRTGLRRDPPALLRCHD